MTFLNLESTGSTDIFKRLQLAFYEAVIFYDFTMAFYQAVNFMTSP